MESLQKIPYIRHIYAWFWPTWQLWMHVYGAQNVQRCSPSAGLGVEGICTGAEEWITGARWCLDIGHKLFNDTYYPITIKR